MAIQTYIDRIRQAALDDLETFIRLVHPVRQIPVCHQELIDWWTRPEAKSHQLVLLPRDHGKSAMVAYRVAWEITKNPALRVLYISSTSNLAEKQLKFIKDILTSPIYRKYWPEMINLDEQKREKWTEREIAVDHPIRKEKIVRDPTIFTAGLTTGIVGLHCDIAVLDDVVVPDNAYTPEGREKVSTQAGYLSSIAGSDARVWVVGTRYHPDDLYNSYQGMLVEIFDKDGEIVESEPLYETYKKEVESNGDGTGEYLWPRTQAPNGDYFGFNQALLAKKKASYTNQSHYRAQYYNNPNDYGTATITPDMFQYFDRKLLKNEGGNWYYQTTRLNIFAAVDFAYSVDKDADYTAIVVVGIDSQHNIYVLDIVRFKTKKISEYFENILRLYGKWGFRKLRAEITAAQDVIVNDLKTNYIRRHGLVLSIEENRPVKKKEERIEAALQPRYSNLQMWHYRGGNTELLEEELVQQNPAHDDIKDCLAAVVETAVPPSQVLHVRKSNKSLFSEYAHPRFGGIS